MSVTPIFLLSLPRAGSTLLQRLLSLHEDVSTKSEPWIALPLFFATRNEGTKSIYGHATLATGVNGFIESFPNKKDDYHSSVATFLHTTYSLSAEPGSKYFLDKTPRYHLIVDDLLKAFPDAKFIFLWRNPLAIAASMLKTYGHGKWILYMFLVDLYSGIDSLVNAFNKNSHRAIAVKYEDLVEAPDKQIIRLMEYLALDSEIDVTDGLKSAEKMWGDRTGQYKYKSISTASMNAWKIELSNPFRKAWSKNYLDWIGEERLNTMGYDLTELSSEIDNCPVSYKFLISDIIRSIYGKIYCRYAIDEIRRNRPWNNKIYFPKN